MVSSTIITVGLFTTLHFYPHKLFDMVFVFMTMYAEWPKKIADQRRDGGERRQKI